MWLQLSESDKPSRYLPVFPLCASTNFLGELRWSDSNTKQEFGLKESAALEDTHVNCASLILHTKFSARFKNPFVYSTGEMSVILLGQSQSHILLQSRFGNIWVKHSQRLWDGCLSCQAVQLFRFPQTNYHTSNFWGLWGSGFSWPGGIVQVENNTHPLLHTAGSTACLQSLTLGHICLFLHQGGTSFYSSLFSLAFSTPVLFSSSGVFPSTSCPIFLFHTGFHRSDGEEKLQP